MADTNHERVGKVLTLLSDGLAPFVERTCRARHGADWARHVASGGGAAGQRPADVHFQLKVMVDNWQDIFRDVLGHAERSYVSELLDARNRWAHQNAFSTDDADRTADTAHRLLLSVSARDQALAVEKLRQELRRRLFEEQERQTQRRAAVAPLAGQPSAGLMPWREIVAPHADVRSGRYAQAEFMADLHQVWRDEASDEYRKPEEFFRRTFLTEGLRQLLLDAVRRWRREGGDPVIELQTSFGGGKTHSLIALYHLAQGYLPSQLPGVEGMLAEAGLDAPPKVATAVLVGQKITPGRAETKPDGTTIRTLWGELAWQLGGPEGYALVAEADATSTNPGASLVELLRRCQPCLVLIDEWVAYARQLYHDSSLPAGTFDTQFTFAQALAEAAAAVPGALLVLTVPASDIEVGGEGGREALVRVKNVIGRVQTSWRPASSEEGFHIVRRRLFEAVPPELAPDRDAVVRAFASLYQSQKAEFPGGCGEGEYERRLRAAYPIHPELFDNLYGDWSTLEKFQQTRGVLRLMAATVQQLWERGDPGLMIMPASVPIDAPAVFSELTRYLGDEWKPIIETDVDGPNALPLRLDRENSNLGRHSATRRVARTIYMGSAPVQQAANRGIDDRSIKLGCVQPGESPAVFGDALRRLTSQAIHLYADKDRYWYSTQPSVAALARDRAQSHVTAEQVDEEIRRLVKPGPSERGPFAAVHPAPASPGDVPDEDGARLVILGPEHPHIGRAPDSSARSFALEVLVHRAAGDRIRRNMLVFLAPDAARLEELRQAARMKLAWETVDRDKETLPLGAPEKRLIEASLGQWSETVAGRLLETYQWVLTPAQKDPRDPAISWEETRVLGPGPLAVRVAKRLEAEEKLLTRYGGVRLRLDLDAIPLWRGDSVGLRQLWDDHARYLYLPRLLDADVLAGAVADGIAQTTWDPDTFAYASAQDSSSGRYLGLIVGAPGSVRVDSSSLLVKPEVARRQLEAEAHMAETSGAAANADALGADAPESTGSPLPGLARQSTKFYGRTYLDPVRLLRDMGTIADEIVQRLHQVPGAEVKVALEITAETPDGFDDVTQRTIEENARTLRFEEHEFESG
ncbi:MAG: Swt1 family HEPN domain-containing protein [Candidatus Dormibacteraceae bacterium]